MDCQIDMVTPLVTQLTYEGLIDEMFGVRNSVVQLPAARFAMDDDTPRRTEVEDDPDVEAGQKMISIPLSANEEMYAELRDKNFNAVSGVVNGNLRYFCMSAFKINKYIKQFPKCRTPTETALHFVCPSFDHDRFCCS